jgi:uncharacterized protein (DUF924 family)
MLMQAKEVLDFWFSERCRKCWFDSTEAFDQEIQQGFEEIWKAARDGELDSWKQTPEGTLALVIILDQFPLNMYRGRPESFSTEARSREIARYALEQGFDLPMDEAQKLFLYLPFMHSEDLADQNVSVDLFEKSGMETRWALHHRDIVRRFGRFPHRNAILGRESNEAEQAYLDSDDAFKG